MPQLRSEQIQNFTLTNAQIAVNAAISQSKIANLLAEPNGWISKGIVNVVATTAELPVWDGGQAGRFYYDTSTDELWMGTGTDPFKYLVTGPGFSGFAEGQDLKTLVQEGSQATDFALDVGRTFEFVGESFASDGSDSFVYLNGALQKSGNNDDFDYISPSTIQFNFDLTSTDRVSIVFVTTAYMTNYTTKAYVGSTSTLSGASRIGFNAVGNLDANTVQGALEELQQDIDMITGGSNLIYSMQDAYEDGSVVTLNTNDVDFRVPSNKSFKISDGSGSVATAAYQVINLGGEKAVAENTGLNSLTQYFFRSHGTEYSINVGTSTTFGSVMTLMNDVIPNYKFEIRNGNLVCVSKVLGSGISVDITDGASSPRLLSTLTGFIEIQAYVPGVDATSASPILDINNGSSSQTITAYADIIPATTNIDLGSASNKFGSIYAQDAHFDVNTIYLGADAQLKVDNGSFKFTTDGGTTFAEIPKANIPDQPTVVQASVDQPLSLASTGTGTVELSSETKVSISSPLVELTGNIVPTTTDLYSIGSDTKKLAHVWAEEVHVGASSLYVNGKKVIEDVTNTMTFSTETDQSMNVKTKGTGNLVLISENEINAQANGGLEWTVPATTPSKNIEFTNLSANGNITFNSANQIQFTAPTVSTGNLTVTGNLSVTGTTTSVNTTELLIQDNIVTLNKNQTGTPSTALISGIEIERGDENNYRFIFKELDDTFRIGISGSEQAVATREDSPATNSGIAVWDNTNNRFNTTAVTISGTTVTGNISGSSGSCTGNASTATTLQTARTIGISGKVTGTATSFNGSGNITISTTAASITSDEVSDATNANTWGTIVKRNPSDGSFSAGTITATGFVGPITGNASTATAFNSTRTLTLNGAASTTINTTSSNGTYTLSIAGIKVNAATNADTVTTLTKAQIEAQLTGAITTHTHSTTIGTTAIATGSSSTTLAGLTSVTSTTFVGALTGNASTSTTATSANAVRGVNFHADTTAPSGTTQLNCDGYLYATKVYNAVWNDLAEFMPKSENANPGEVLIMTEGGVAPSKLRGDRAVVGVYSDTFGYALGADDQENKCPVGISGRVWVKVKEEVKIGDLLISDENGFATKATKEEALIPGIIIGKVMENKTDSSVSRVSILIMNR